MTQFNGIRERNPGELMYRYFTMNQMCTAYNKEHGTHVKPWKCVRYKAHFLDEAPENVNGDPHFTGQGVYEFAIAIAQGSPVFAGDKLWFEDESRVVQALGVNVRGDVRIEKFRSVPPNSLRRLVTAVATVGLEKFNLCNTGEIRQPRAGEYVHRNGDFLLCRNPDEFGDDSEVWRLEVNG